jgi:hypothetical protein
MKRFAALSMLIWLLSTSTAAATEPPGEPPQPPDRLKKKDTPPAPKPIEEKGVPMRNTEQKEPVKPADSKDEPPRSRNPMDNPEAPEPIDQAEVLTRVAKNMRSSEDHLAKKDTGDGTRQIQRDILKDLDALIEATKRQQQQQQQQQNSPGASSSKSKRKQTAQGKRTQKDTAPSNKSASRKDQPRDQTANQNGNGGTTKTTEGMTKLADLYKDVWGHLPETLRQEMDQYSREQFMAKYNELLKQYYATIAAKGHRKGE